MTDLYVRRGETTNVRKRVTILILLVCAIAALAVFLQRSCAQRRVATMDESELPELLTVEGALGNDLEGMTRPEPSADEPSATPTSAPKLETPARPGPDRPKPTAPTADRKPAPRPVAKSTAPAGAGQTLRRAAELQKEGALQEAREHYLQVYAGTQDPETRALVMDRLGSVGIELLMTPRPMPEKEDYTVQSGDSLAKLAKKFSTTIELIKKSNNISGSMIRVGDRLRIFSGTFSVKIDKSDNLLDLYLNDAFFKRYRVGTGEYNRTPVGDFKITDRIPQPTWWRPDGKSVPYGDPDNELGTHWLSLDIRGYGIHGTWEPDTIGQQASAGCVRLINEEIEELYSILPTGTAVSITD